MNFVEVRFRSGRTQRFQGARDAAKRSGYPDVPSYLLATGQVSGWCEEVSEAEVAIQLKAEECRRHCQLMAMAK